MKTCIKCKIEQNLSEFRVENGSKLNVCKQCKRNAERERYRSNPDSLLIQRYKNYRHSDKKDGHQTICREKAIQLMKQPCHWCENTTDQIGLDRINNMLGHAEDNVVPSCEKCNQIRGDIPYAAMLLLQPALREINRLGLLKDWEPPYKRAYFRNRHRVRYE